MPRYVQLFTAVFNDQGMVEYCLVPEDHQLFADGAFVDKFVNGDFDCSSGMTDDAKEIEALLEPFKMHTFCPSSGMMPPSHDGVEIVKQHWRYIVSC